MGEAVFQPSLTCALDGVSKGSSRSFFTQVKLKNLLLPILPSPKSGGGVDTMFLKY